MKAYCTQNTDRECREGDCCLNKYSEFYKLDENKNAIPCSAKEWGWQRQVMTRTNTKHVAEEQIGDFWISTVWLGINHQYGNGKPLIFETMVFKNESGIDAYCDRYSTWKEAEEGHKRAVEWVKNGCKDE